MPSELSHNTKRPLWRRETILSFSGNAGLLGAYKTLMVWSYFHSLFIYFQTLNQSGPNNSGVLYSFTLIRCVSVDYDTLVLATFLRPCWAKFRH